MFKIHRLLLNISNIETLDVKPLRKFKDGNLKKQTFLPLEHEFLDKSLIMSYLTMRIDFVR